MFIDKQEYMDDLVATLNKLWKCYVKNLCQKLDFARIFIS